MFCKWEEENDTYPIKVKDFGMKMASIADVWKADVSIFSKRDVACMIKVVSDLQLEKAFDWIKVTESGSSKEEMDEPEKADLPIVVQLLPKKTNSFSFVRP